MAAQGQKLAGVQAGLTELRNRLLFVFVALIVSRVGSHIPVPGINPDRLRQLFEQNQGGILDLFNMFSGGALHRMSILALGVMPYITSSIIMNLLTMMHPPLQQLRKEGEAGRRKITQYTRYGTLLVALIQGSALAATLANQGLAFTPELRVPLRRDHGARYRCAVHDVARRADHRARRRQRYFAVDLLEHRVGFPGRDRALVRSGAAGRHQHRRAARHRRVRHRRRRLRGVHRTRSTAHHGQLRETPAGAARLSGAVEPSAAEGQHGRRHSGDLRVEPAARAVVAGAVVRSDARAWNGCRKCRWCCRPGSRCTS